MKNSYHIMLDIETLGTLPGSVVWQIGAVGTPIEELMSPYLGPVGYVGVAYDTLFYGTKALPRNIINAAESKYTNSLHWQLSHNRANFDRALMDEDNNPQSHTLQGDELIISFINAMQQTALDLQGKYSKIVWWAKSVRFDYPILEAEIDGKADSLGLHKNSYPWRYWELQELRTALLLAGLTGKEGRAQVNAHDALEDAAHQLNLLSYAMRTLSGRDSY